MTTVTNPKTNKRQQQKLNTRQNILEAAGSLFAEKGIMTTSTAEIAKRAGVAHGTLFVHFPTREELITDVITFSLGSMAKKLHDETQGVENIEELVHRFMNAMASHEKLYLSILTEKDRLPSLAQSTLLGIYSSFSDKLYKSYKNSVKTKKLNPSRLFITWISLLNFYVTNASSYSDTGTVMLEKKDEIIQHFLELI